MNRILIVAVSLFLSVGLMACKTGKNVKSKDGKGKNMVVVQQNKDYVQPEDMPSFEITDMKIEGDIAELFITYSGGCNQHEFKAYFNGAFMKSMPPKVNVMIEHDSKGDSCRELVSDTLYIDLKEVRYTKDKPGTVIVLFNGTDKSLTYEHK